jgi:hypothetical protein
MKVLIAAVIFLWVYAAFASAPPRSYYAGITGVAEVDLSPTNAAGEVLLRAVTNSAGVIRVTRFLPPDHNWTFRFGSTSYGITYYGTKAPTQSQGTWVMGFGRSLSLPVHPFAVIATLGALVAILIVITWKAATKGMKQHV